MVQEQPEGAFSNAQIKAVAQSLTQEALEQNIRQLGADISKEVLALFERQIAQVRRL
ncbi:MAG: hypothetical protein PHC64_09745 [Candidatus Gastranaerophilales bacterium]|nr:hypothetical protein [Candidatus Gastranaerophilales bacterium]